MPPRFSFTLRTTTVALLLASSCQPVFAAGSNPSAEPWYKIAAGIIAIPAAIFGLLVSYRLLRKTNLETRKLELDLQEKQRIISAQPMEAAAQLERSPNPPIFADARLSNVILRFIVLELTLRLWDFVPSATRFAISTLASAYFWFMSSKQSLSRLFSTIAIAAVPEAIRLLLDTVYWFIVFGFGWPLLKDSAALLGIRFEGLFDLPRLGKKRPERGDT